MSEHLPGSTGLIQNAPETQHSAGIFDHLRSRWASAAAVGVAALSLLVTPGEQPAYAADDPRVTVGMPFDGKWGYNVPTSADCGTESNQTSHPSCHEIYSGNWSTDLYAAAGTEVKLKVSGDKLSFEWDTNVSGTCGATRRINIFSDAVKVGDISFAHMSEAAPTSTKPTNGMTLGKIANLGCNPGHHVHTEFRNTSSSTKACYVNYSSPANTAGIPLNEGTPLGILGSPNTAPKQPCSGDIPSGGGTPPVSNVSNTVRRVLHTTDNDTNLAFWAKQDTVFESSWRPGGSGVQLAQIAHGPDIADIEVQLKPDHQRLVYTANKDGTVTESWYYPGQAIHSGTIIRDGGRIKDIEKSVGPSGEQQLYVMAPEGIDEYWWYPGGEIHKSRLYSLLDPVAMKKTPIEPDGTQILYVADRSHVYENAWKPGLGLSTGGEVLFIPQADITDMDVTIDPDGKHRAYVGRERDGLWEGAWYRGQPVTSRQLAGGDGIRDIEAHRTGDVHQLYAATAGGVFEYWWTGEGPTTGSVITQAADIHSIDRSTTVDGLPAVYTGAGAGVVESWWGDGGMVRRGVVG